MNKYILTTLIFSLILMLSSCKKFLEEQSQSDVIPKTAQALNEMLLGAVYTNVTPHPYNGTQRLLDDDVTQNAHYSISNNLIGVYTWQPESALEDNRMANPEVWGGLYSRIIGSNLVLQYLPKVNGTIAEKENVAGQAYLMRAYYYFMLVNYFGKPYTDRLSNPDQDPGVPLILSGNLSLEGKPRNTVAKVYQQVLSDLEEGISLLERNGKNNNRYRINHVAGYLLASRVHLYMGNWQKVIDAANHVLSRRSELMNLATWGVANPDTKPIVDLQNVETIWGHGSYDAVYRPSTGQTEEFNYRLSDELLSLFEEGDLRSGIYFKNKQSAKRTSLALPDKVSEAFRVSEALLNRAEAYAQLNKLGQSANAQLALNDLNTLRKNRFSTASYRDLSATDANDLLQKCADERRREFFVEEAHRWFDLRRSGMPAIKHIVYVSDAQSLTYTLGERDPAYLMQIPKKVLDKNPKLIANPMPDLRVGL
jgi:starch-binding outer membrane protein, SusD/RagB family